MIRSLSPFEELFKSNYKRLCNVANRITRDRDAAEDIVQEVFIKLWNRSEQLTPISNMPGYLLRATVNSSISYLESVKHMVPLNQTDVQLAVDQHGGIVLKELEKKIQYALKNLPPKCRAIFVLSRLEGMKYREIAEHLEISVKTVENQMGIALDRMREELKPYLTREYLISMMGTGISFLIQFLSVTLTILLFHRYF